MCIKKKRKSSDLLDYKILLTFYSKYIRYKNKYKNIMKTKIFFLVIIISILSTMSLSAQTEHVYLDSTANHSRLYYHADSVKYVVIHQPHNSVGGEFLLPEGLVVFAENITITQENQGLFSWSDMMSTKELSIYFIYFVSSDGNEIHKIEKVK